MCRGCAVCKILVQTTEYKVVLPRINVCLWLARGSLVPAVCPLGPFSWLAFPFLPWFFPSLPPSVTLSLCLSPSNRFDFAHGLTRSLSYHPRQFDSGVSNTLLPPQWPFVLLLDSLPLVSFIQSPTILTYYRQAVRFRSLLRPPRADLPQPPESTPSSGSRWPSNFANPAVSQSTLVLVS